MSKKKTNFFTDRMSVKSTPELEYMVNYPDLFQKEAVQAAIWILEKRSAEPAADGETNSDLEGVNGEWQFTKFIKGIKKKHSVNFTPSYKEKIQCDLPFEQISVVGKKVFEKLEWHLVHYTPDQLEAIRAPESESTSEKITLKIDRSGEVEIKSKSLGSESWDMGRNSIKVKLFIHVFNELIENTSTEDIKSLVVETERELNWDDYEIPETLPAPPQLKAPNFITLLLFSMTGAILIGFILAFASKFVHIIILYEGVAGFLLGVVIFQGIKASNYLHLEKVHLLLIACVISIVILNQYFQFLLIINNTHDVNLSFIDFIQIRLTQGFMIEGFNTGWIGWLIAWALQGGIIYLVSWFKLTIQVTKFLLERIPQEVLEFATYHVIKGKNEDEVISELSKKGWKEATAQQSVIDAIGASFTAQDIRRGN